MAATLYLIRLDGTFARIDGVVATPTLENLTGKGDPYRDIFQTTARTSATGLSGVGADGSITYPGSVLHMENSLGDAVLDVTADVLSDEVAHEDPRQADQLYTMWKFDLGVVASTPQYLYAEFRRGDIIGNNPPNTDPAA